MKFSFPSISIPEFISQENWNSWNWQLRNSLKKKEDFDRYFRLSSDEMSAFTQGSEIFNIRTTPYYSVLAGSSEHSPIRKILMPHKLELDAGVQSMLDPLGEKKNNPTPRIIHRYPDRVLFLITDICSVYCRYCTRKHFTGAEQAFVKQDEFSAAIKYIQSKPGIREVILSGGDPLTVSDEQLLRTLHEIRKIEHIEIIRIGSRMPVVCPMRVDQNLVKEIRKYKPVFLMTHFNHPKEITEQSASALELFVDHGVPVFNQMVLLNGINNHPAIVQALSRRLLFLRVKPYYMFQCDPSIGTDHLRTSIEDSEKIQKELWGNLSGLAMPNLSVDIPDGGGKVGITPQFEISKTGNERVYLGWDQVKATYKNPKHSSIIKPFDAEEYFSEWEELKNSKN
jgi:lysine 2,3-aminomutase